MTRARGGRARLGSSARVGAALIGALVAFAAVTPLFSRDPNESDFSLARDVFGAPPGPSRAHWLGTDALFRDELARLAAGARVSLSVALAATTLAAVIGTLVGVLAGTFSEGRARSIDAALMRLVDVLLALPFLLFVTAIGAALGRADLGSILIVLGLTGWAGIARVVRAKTLQLRASDFVLAARGLGASPLRVALRHVLPNVLGTVAVVASSLVAHMILAEAVLGYLAVGLDPPRATWGRMLREGEPFLATRLSLVLLPGLLVLIAVLGWNRLGEGLRDALEPADHRAPSRRLGADLVLVAAALLLLPLSTPSALKAPGASGDGREARRGGTLRVATFLSPRSLDPALASDEGVLPILDLVFARLMTWDANGNLVPELASRVDASPDGTTFTFELREAARFHDGSEVRAPDLVRSIERALSPKTPSPSASAFAMIEGFEAYRSGKAPHLAGVRALSERTLEVRLASADASFLARTTLAAFAPVCASMGARVDVTRPATACGAGPFRVASFDAEGGLRLARHEAYFEPGKPHLDAISWTFGVRPQTQRYMLESGELDHVRELSASDAALFRADPRWSATTRFTTKRSTTAIFLNTEVPPFTSRLVRRAVAQAIDASVLERVNPLVAATERVVPPSVPGASTEPARPRFDLDAARASMAEAGFPFDPATGRGGVSDVLDYVTVPGSFEQQAGEVFQQQLARIGVRIRLRLLSFASYYAEVGHRRRAALGWVGWNADYPDAANFFEPTLSSGAIDDEASGNVAFFSKPELDAALDEARRTLDPEARRRLIARCERIVRDEAPWVPVYNARSLEAWLPRVKNYRAHPFLPLRFGDVWIDDGVPAPLGPLGSLAR